MSVLDEITGLQEKVRSRMVELRPLLDEYAELQKAAERLGIDEPSSATPVVSGEPDASQPAKKRSRRRSSTKPARAAKTRAAKAAAADSQAPASGTSSAKTSKRSATSSKTKRQPGGSRSGHRAEQIAALVAQNPGITVKGIGEQVGADPTSLYRVVKQLESAGKLEKRGRELHPA